MGAIRSLPHDGSRITFSKLGSEANDVGSYPSGKKPITNL